MKSFRTVRYETGKDTGKAALTFAHLSDLHGCFTGKTRKAFWRRFMRQIRIWWS